MRRQGGLEAKDAGEIMKVMTQTGVCLLWWLLAVLVLAVSLGYLGGLHRSNGQVGKMDRSKKAVTLSQYVDKNAFNIVLLSYTNILRE